MAKRVSKKVISGISSEEFTEAVSAYALNDAMQKKTVAALDKELTAIREKYREKLEDMEQYAELKLEIIQAYCTENKKVLFGTVRHIETIHGNIGFRLGTPKLKTLPKWNWEKVLDKLKTVLPDYVRTKSEPDKEAIIRDRLTEVVAPHLNDVGLYVDQDETFYVEMKTEENG